MKTLLLPLLLPFAVVLGPVPLHAQSASQFQLPPDPEATSTPRQQAQGPIDLEGEERSAPRVIDGETPRPAITLPPPRETQSAAPDRNEAETARVRPTPTPSPGSRPSLPASREPVSTREVLAEPDRSGAAPARATTAAEATNPMAAPPENAPGRETTDVPTGEPAPLREDIARAETALENEGGIAGDRVEPARSNGWLWALAALFALLAVGAVIAGVLRRRNRARIASTASRTDTALPGLSARPPREADGSTAAGQAEPGIAEAGTLAIDVHASSLSRSVLNATVTYRLSIVNRGPRPVSGMVIHGDVTSAHGRAAPSDQLADVTLDLPELHEVARLDPGQRIVLTGTLRLPLDRVRALWQGSVPVFVPLLRLVAKAQNMEPRAHTYVIGMKAGGANARPNPFRLDESPRNYAQLTTRALA